MNNFPNIEPSSIRNFEYLGTPIIRFGSVIYGDLTVGRYFETGHNVVIRQGFECGTNVSIGTNTVIDGKVKLGSYVKVSTGCYLPPGVIIEDKVFLGPNVTFTNDAFPLKRRPEYTQLVTTVRNNVSFGAGSVVLPGITIGENSFIAAGAIVTKNIPKNSLVMGHGLIKKCPVGLQGENRALSWKFE